MLRSLYPLEALCQQFRSSCLGLAPGRHTYNSRLSISSGLLGLFRTTLLKLSRKLTGMRDVPGMVNWSSRSHGCVVEERVVPISRQMLFYLWTLANGLPRAAAAGDHMLHLPEVTRPGSNRVRPVAKIR